MFRRFLSTRPPPRPTPPSLLRLLMPVTVVLGVVVAYRVGRMTSPWLTLLTTPVTDLDPPRYALANNVKQAIKEIESLGVEVSSSAADIAHHTLNEFTPHLPLPEEKPQYIIYPTLTELVAAVMKVLHRYLVAVVPFSGGLLLEGHFYNTRQGVCVDTLKMNRILQVNHDDLDCVVEAGVNWVDLNDAVAPYALEFGCDCGPQGLMGGMVATNALGINAVAHGLMLHNVIGVTAVLADGTVIHTKQRPRKLSAGYNLTALMVGSEGTLGIVTEATVKLHVKPQCELTVVGQFASVRDTTDVVSHLFRLGIHPHHLELCDADMMKCFNYAGYTPSDGTQWAEVPTLFIKVGGILKLVVKEYVSQIKHVASQHHCHRFTEAQNQTDADLLWGYRKHAFFAMLDYARHEIDPDVRVWVTDIAVPVLRLSDTLAQCRALIEASGFESVVLAHAGDGNIHADLFYTEKDEHRCKQVVDSMVAVGLANEGTCLGEHGVGNLKRRYLIDEVGAPAVDTMRRIKLALDPKRILNPDKVFTVDPDDERDY